MAVNTPLFRMTDRMVGGDLAERLAKYRADGVAWEKIAALLFAEHGVEVTPVTLREWHRLAGGDEPEAKVG